MSGQTDRGHEDYAAIYSKFLRRGYRGLTEAESRSLTIGSGGTALAPTRWSDYIGQAVENDFMLGRVQRIESTTAFKLPVYANDITGNNNVAEEATGTESTPTFALPQQGTGGATTYTFSLKKITARVRVSNELLADSKAAADVDAFLMKELVSALITRVNSQIVHGNGTTQCQGSYRSATAYSQTVSTGVATTNTAKDVISAVWAGTNTTEPVMPYESWVNSVAVVNSRTVANFDATFYPVLFPVFRGSMQNGTTVEGLPTIYHRLTTTTPASGDTLVHFVDPTRYLLVTDFSGFSVARFTETFADTNETLFFGSVRADGSIMNKSAVLNVNRA